MSGNKKAAVFPANVDHDAAFCAALELIGPCSEAVRVCTFYKNTVALARPDGYDPIKWSADVWASFEGFQEQLGILLSSLHSGTFKADVESANEYRPVRIAEKSYGSCLEGISTCAVKIYGVAVKYCGGGTSGLKKLIGVPVEIPPLDRQGFAVMCESICCEVASFSPIDADHAKLELREERYHWLKLHGKQQPANSNGTTNATIFPMTDAAEAVLDIMAKNIGKKLKQVQIASQLRTMRRPLGEHSIRSALELLCKKGFVNKEDGQQGYVITEAGAEYLKSIIAAP